MRASRKRGQWTGGHVPLGYDLDPNSKRLVIHQAEAEQVRAIFDLFCRTEDLSLTLAEINLRGWTTKRRTVSTGGVRGGMPFRVPALRRLLANVLYTGSMRHGKEVGRVVSKAVSHLSDSCTPG
jgi:site-specific DNA recombinase